ncbi:MAG: redoxin family protein [Verrucomicrobia bacterium]|nr:redoxin family protein [Verrucomicrobiota bacterium]
MIRMRRQTTLLLLLSLFSLCTSSIGAETKDKTRVDSVSLSIKDVKGVAQTPFDLKGAVASVLIFVMHDCPISNAYARELERLRRDYGPKRIRFQLVFVDSDLTVAALEKHNSEYGLTNHTTILDSTHALVKATGATVTPEAVVVGANGKILYRGRIDNLYSAWGKSRGQATEKDLRQALDAVVKGKAVTNSRTKAIGCYIPTN